MEVFTKSAQESFELGKNFAASLKGGDVLALVGDLGSGKTTFVQGLARGLGINERILSPTFVLMRQYNIKSNKQEAKSKNLYHVDLYRLAGDIEQEYRNLGLEEIVNEKENIVVIEWAEKASNALPEKAIWVRFENLDGDERRITIKL